MARQKKEEPTRHRLLIYYNLGKRYRSPGILLIFLGLFMFFPSFIDELKNDMVSTDVLAVAGGAFVLIGLAFWLFSWLAIHRSYVQTNPDLLLIRTPFHKTLCQLPPDQAGAASSGGSAFSPKHPQGDGQTPAAPLASRNSRGDDYQIMAGE